MSKISIFLLPKRLKWFRFAISSVISFRGKRIGKIDSGSPCLVRFIRHCVPILLIHKSRCLVFFVTFFRSVKSKCNGLILFPENSPVFFPVQDERSFFSNGNQDIFIASRTNRVKSHSRKNIPCRRLPVVFITAITVWGRCIKLIHHFTRPVLGFPGFSGIIVELYHVLNGLIPVSILPHIHNLHLPDFVNWKSVISCRQKPWHLEN